MNNNQAMVMVDTVFNKLYQARSIQDLVAVLESDLGSKRMDPITYPKIEFSITPEEIDLLVEQGLLDQSGNLPLDISSRDDLTPLTKLLYSVLWKNGDLKKIHNVVKGVSEPDRQVNSGIVFFQFGRYLNKTGEPIVDQHILRSFALHFSSSEDAITSIRKKDTTVSKDWQTINDYKSWLVSSKLNDSLKAEDDYVYYVDQVLFALGRAVKLSKKS